jgi:transglutaminase-like putative cysteine protease
MKYQVTHQTHYIYRESVSLCHSEARLFFRHFPGQNCLQSNLTIDPSPDTYREREDFFGNRVGYFAIQRPHSQLKVTATSIVNRNIEQMAQPELFGLMSWEFIRDAFMHRQPDLLEARPFVLDSPLVAASPEMEVYARPSFQSRYSLFEAAYHLMERIHDDFDFVPGFTNVTTPLAEVMKQRKGVCQDFAHVAIGCLRSMGLAARYVSGYLETIPPPGQEPLTGTDASHAWFSVYIPGMGWVDFDPTNRQIPGNHHLVVAWGRDYSDVVPLRGVIFSSGGQRLSVGVEVKRLDK